MALSDATKLGSYEILGRLGAGAMGEVYRARDGKLKRDVAIKVLPDALSGDENYVHRFQREAEVLASLNHPNIAAIYDLEEFDNTKFLVLELVEGETLTERLQQGPIPMDEALRMARQIAGALAAAHEKGITHRDLKPSNLKIAPGGSIKVLDFGLAKIRGAREHTDSPANSPTTFTGSTGMILGTAAYMSPEQAKSQDVDRRSDVWAFGCVLYEMLTGRRAFEGEAPAEILGAVLRAEPDWKRLPSDTPLAIRRLLRRCLQKDRDHRLHDLADAQLEIDEAALEPVAGIHQGDTRSLLTRERVAWILVLLTVAGFAIREKWRNPPSQAELRLDLSTPSTTDSASFALSPDGRTMVYVATSENRARLWLRDMGSTTSRTLPGTDGAEYPFWSPDGRSIGFFADGKLKRIESGGGSVVVLAPATIGRGGAWTKDGSIFFTPTTVSGIFRVDAVGGTASEVTKLKDGEISHRFPRLLPEERHLIYYVVGNTPEARGVYTCDIDGSNSRRLFDSDTPALFVAPGHLLFVRQGALFAYNFRPDSREVSGNPFVVAEQVYFDQSDNLSAVTASANGTFAYRTGVRSSKRQFVWFDRSGNELEKIGSPDDSTMWSPAISPDGKRLAVHRTINGNVDVWLLDLASGKYSQFTSNPNADVFAMWSPDGSRIIFDSNRKGAFNFYEKAVGGESEEKPLYDDNQTKGASDWSPDGRYLLYRGSTPQKTYDLFALSLDGSKKPFVVAGSNAEERDGQFSPDGKWIAFQSNEPGHSEVYVQPFPGPGNKSQVSKDGGAQVRWRKDGKELFYIALDGRLMSVQIRIGTGSTSVDADPPVPLFQTRVGGAIQGIQRQQYVVSSDGKRFLMNTLVEEAPAPITLVLNWKRKP